MRTYPSHFQLRTLWSAATFVGIAVIVILAVTFIWLVSQGIAYMQPILVPLAVAGIMAYLLDPIVEIMVRLGMRRIYAIGVIFVLASLFMALMFFAVVPRALGQAVELFHRRADIIHKVEIFVDAQFERMAPMLKSMGLEEDEEDPVVPVLPEVLPAAMEGELPAAPALAPAPATAAPPVEMVSGKKAIYNWRAKSLEYLRSEQTTRNVGHFIATRFTGLFGMLGYLIGFILVPLYLFFFLKESAKISQTWSDYLPLRASQFKDELVGTVREINGYLIAFFRGQVVVSIIDGVLTGIALKILGLKYAFLIGAFLGLFGIVPFIGILVTAIPAMLIAAWQWGDWQHPAIVLVIFLVVQQIDGLFVQPKIVGDAVGLHPLTVIFSVLFWSFLIGGILGALLAVPLTASIKVILRRYVWEKQRARLQGGGVSEENTAIIAA